MGDREYGQVPPPDYRAGRDDGGRDRGRERDRERDGGGGRERDSRRDERAAPREERSSGRERDRGRERDERPREREERPSERASERSSRRSRTRSGSPAVRTRKPRVTKFDLLPEGMTPGSIPVAGPPPTLMLGSLGGLALPALQSMPAVTLPSFGQLGGLGGMLGSLPGAPATQQATRHARRIYVGGLPPSANEQSIATFFSHALAAIGGNTAGPGNAVVNVYINREKNFSFVEFRTVEETSNAMALDGIMFEGVTVRVRRPNDYNPASAAGLGPSLPNPNLNLIAIGMSAPGGGGGGGGGSSSTGPDAAERVFVGGLPYYLTEDQCRELLGSFGPIKSFDLVKDRETGLGKGYGFVVYGDPSVTDIACAGLNGLKMGDRTLTVRRATEGPGGAGAAAPPISMAMPFSLGALGGLGGAPLFGMPVVGGFGVPAAPVVVPTRIVVLAEAVTLDELQKTEDYNDILDDMREEGNKHGQLTNILIPRPSPEQPTPPGLGKVVLEFADIASAQRSRNAMHGRRFGGRTVVAVYLPEDKYAAGLYDHLA